MPTLYPSPPPSAVRRDPRKRAEVRVYDALAAALPAEYDVFHSVARLDKGCRQVPHEAGA